jgi:hypothetical protein
MGKIKHIALFKFKEGTSEEQINQLFDDILDITENIEVIEDYVAGENNSPEGLNQGYTQGIVMQFADAAARDTYLTHPEHEKIKGLILPHTESVLVFDFEL